MNTLLAERLSNKIARDFIRADEVPYAYHGDAYVVSWLCVYSISLWLCVYTYYGHTFLVLARGATCYGCTCKGYTCYGDTCYGSTSLLAMAPRLYLLWLYLLGA